MFWAGFVLLVASIVLLNLFFADARSFRSHPWRWLVAQATPWLLPLVCWALFSYASWHDRRMVDDLNANGVEASATVTSVRDIAVGMKVFPVVRVGLRVTPPNTPPFDTDVALEFSELAINDESSRGRLVEVRYDPHDRSRVVIVK